MNKSKPLQFNRMSSTYIFMTKTFFPHCNQDNICDRAELIFSGQYLIICEGLFLSIQ